MNCSINAVIFDMDGTLYDEMTFVYSGFRSVSRYISPQINVELDTLFREMKEHLESDGRGKIFDSVLIQHDAYSPQLVKEMINIYRSHIPDILLYPDVTGNLVKLSQRGLKTGIITDGLHSVQKLKVNALKLYDYVDFIIYTDELGYGCEKPNPIGFLYALEKENMVPKNVIYIGNDPIKDIQGALSVGIIAIHICRERYFCNGNCGSTIHVRTLDELFNEIIPSIGVKK